MNVEGGYFCNSGILYRMAIRAYNQTEDAPSDTVSGQDDALTAVLFAAATLEAFIVEFSFFAEIGTQLSNVSSSAASLADMLNEAESSRGSVRLKYLIAKSILSGKPYDKGRTPYQDFDLLFTIRDAILHHKPEKIRESPHKIVAALMTRHLCERAKAKTTWLHQITTRAVAKWACNVVRDMVASLTEHIPDDAEKTINPFVLLKVYTKGFSGID